MPELPEVETVKRGLSKQLPGRKITAVKVLREASVETPDVASFKRSLKSRIFTKIERRGKYLLFFLETGDGLVIHLRMSGRLLLMPSSSKKPPYLRVEFSLDDGNSLFFDDMRVFGRVWYVPAGNTFESIVSGLQNLGPEPLESLHVNYLGQALRNKSQPIKATLLDQTVIAGIGNIYADEALHLAGINPSRPAKTLSSSELKTLIRRIQEVLSNAIVLGGSTLRNYTNESGVNGNYQHEAYVYGRNGAACRLCKTTIQRVRLAGRSSHFCPQCQPLEN